MPGSPFNLRLLPTERTSGVRQGVVSFSGGCQGLRISCTLSLVLPRAEPASFLTGL